MGGRRGLFEGGFLDVGGGEVIHASDACGMAEPVCGVRAGRMRAVVV